MKKISLIGLLLILVLFPFGGYSQPIFIENVPTNSTNFISANGKLYFTSGTDLYRSDGTASGTTFVKSIGEPILEFTSLTVGSFFYFTTLEASGKTALWKSNGFANNTFKIKSANVINPLITFNGSLYLGLNDGVHGYELWRVTSANSFSLVKDVYPGPGSGLGEEILIFDNALYFKGFQPATGSNIWKTNGTSTTNLAVDLPFSGSYIDLTAVGSTLYFARNYVVADSSYAELWKTNGTTAGTSLVKRFAELDLHIGIEQLTYFNSTLYFKFFLDFGVKFENLYVSNGTEAGTVFVETLNIDGSMSDFLKVNNRLVYTGESQGWPGSLIVTDASGSGRYFLHPFNTYEVRRYVAVGDLLFFVDHTEQTYGGLPQDSANYFQIFQSGLLASNTATLQSIFGPSYIGSNNLTEVNGKLFFTTYNDYPCLGCPAKPMKLFIYNPSSATLRAALSENVNVEFNAFPNPSDEQFNFSLVSNANGNATAEIYRVDGTLVSKVFEGTTVEGENIEFSWNAEGLPNGVYFCKYTSGTKSVIKKLVLNN
ncbi:MAG: T9SS type A sorting domain-containing protein [Sporocytophaga sp.]|uniref:T9SS type A sorting domain-containing protein n=1 Tax=Sporocytophaga sp. TaxID=2231183 RepID=UPI001B121260|nr:T9SS type A sorting domain-containing protein [Sporocytophaga sp.]MBO9698883.1 T9SS type A sorting domain-containing protein [Sporocytophaga sp.]